jgi:hypothetical protein
MTESKTTMMSLPKSIQEQISNFIWLGTRLLTNRYILFVLCNDSFSPFVHIEYHLHVDVYVGKY